MLVGLRPGAVRAARASLRLHTSPLGWSLRFHFRGDTPVRGRPRPGGCPVLMSKGIGQCRAGCLSWLAV